MTSPATLATAAPVPGARVPGGLVAAIVVGAGCLLPFVGASPLLLSLLVQAIIGAMLATGVGFLVRQNGMVSFGHALFFGLGGYVLGVPMAHGLLPPEVAVVPALLAFLLGLVITRIPGVAFSMLSLACAQTFYEVVLKVRTLAARSRADEDGAAFAGAPPCLSPRGRRPLGRGCGSCGGGPPAAPGGRRPHPRWRW